MMPAADEERPDDDLDGVDDDFEDDDLGDDADFLRAVAAAPEQAPPPQPVDRIGQRLGHFRILEKLGHGGMGVVYAAEDTKLKRTVALKLLHEGEVQDGERRKRFLREARSASAVSHPNIAAVYEVGEADGAVFIAMERVRGTSLRKRIAQGPMPVPDALAIGVEIARALASAHEAGVVHRDLKPDNVMLMSADAGATLAGASTVKVLDFGLAKILRGRDSIPDAPDDSSSSLDALTQDGRILGTPSYMSPEQASGRSTDARSDVFALGIVLYEMLTGERPFVGATTMDVLVSINRDVPEPVSRKNRAVPSRLSRLVARCLEKDPARRPADCGEIAAELDALAQGLDRPSRTWIAVAGGAAVVAVVTVVALSSTTSTVAPSAQPAASDVPAPSRALPPARDIATLGTERPPSVSAPTSVPTASSVPSAPATASARSHPTPTARPRPKNDPLADQK